ncbi:MAG: hypothetical protein ACYDC1_24620, partial [Limisphaerales bacterium]
ASTSVIWIAVTFLTAPADREQLKAFYRLVRPAGPGWKSIQAETGVGPSPDSLPQAMLCWVAGCCSVYAALFGAGSVLYGQTVPAIFWSVVLLVSGAILWRWLPRIWSGETNPGPESR